MNGAPILVALLCASVGLLLSFSQRRTMAAGLSLLTAAALGTAWIGGVPVSEHLALVAGAGAVGVTGLLVMLPRASHAWLWLLLSGNAGIWAGTLVSLAGRPVMLSALLLALLALPGRWIVERGYAIVLKVVSGWLVAVGILAAALPMLTTPGYAPDHME